MKKWTILLTIVGMLGIAIPTKAAMSITQMRQDTRFLTDRMAYELGLSTQQYNDVYEVNFDFINNVRYLMDDVVDGYVYALERYYDFLDIRNDDLRWILSSTQYRRFMTIDYFYRPINMSDSGWRFSIFSIYTNISFFYFDKPYHYASYNGGHYRTHFNNISYYKTHFNDHYRHEVYNGDFRFNNNKQKSNRNSSAYRNNGSVSRPSMGNNSRQSGNQSGNRSGVQSGNRQSSNQSANRQSASQGKTDRTQSTSGRVSGNSNRPSTSQKQQSVQSSKTQSTNVNRNNSDNKRSTGTQQSGQNRTNTQKASSSKNSNSSSIKSNEKRTSGSVKQNNAARSRVVKEKSN